MTMNTGTSDELMTQIYGTDWLTFKAMDGARSVLDDPCKCEGDHGSYQYRDGKQHCMACDGRTNA